MEQHAPPNARAVFDLALEIHSAAQRQAYLVEACGEDAALRRQVDALLQAYEMAGSFLEAPVRHLDPGATAQETGLCEGPGTMVGRYKLLERLGEGGFGTVFLAEQRHPVRRQVALKVIKAGMDTRQVVARFDAERQTLALMDHPTIAKVLDGGATDSGRPFFVMELVKGVPITRYCDEQRLTPRRRLELFLQVCSAVQHAHTKGVIHRDLKPGNVLVALYDGKPVPKVIDFGVAKAAGGRLTEATLFTGLGAVVGTPEYMSPEQAELNQLDIDTRSDVYSLGVLLYELLTGSTPVERGRFKAAALMEVLRVVREEEPQKPSTRLGTTDGLAGIAACRGLEPKKLSGLVRGDLDWIVMKALEKDRTRRYETAIGLARDVERYLADEAVQACPPSATYKLRKFARRNKGPVLAAALVLLALMAGITGTTAGMALARRSAAAERVARQQALEDKAQTQRRLAQIEKGNRILASVFAHLDPRSEEKEGKPLRALLGERLAQAADQLTGEAVGDPVVVAGLQVALGRSMLGLGMAERAVPLLAEARATLAARLGPDHPDTLTSMDALAHAYRDAGRPHLAVPLFEETLRLCKVKLGPDHPDTLVSMGGLAWAYRAAGKSDLAVPLFEETLRLQKAKLGPDHFDTLDSMNNLATAYQAAGKLDLALPLNEEAVKRTKAKLGTDNSLTLHTMNDLASAYQAAGKRDLALPLFEETLRLRKARLGTDHPDTLTSMGKLASAYRAAGRLDLAVPLFEETLRLQKGKLGPDHPGTLNSMAGLASSYREAGRLALAVPLHEETLRLRRARLGADHPGTLASMGGLGSSYRDAGRVDLAVPLHEETLRLARNKLGADHPGTLDSMSSLALSYRAAGRLDLAVPLHEETLRLREAKLGPDHPDTVFSRGALANAYRDAGRAAEELPDRGAGRDPGATTKPEAK